MYILTKQEMYNADKYTIENIGISGYTLMECAAQEMARAIEKIINNHFKENDKCNILVVCGSGNNGGDGIVVARRLLQKGFSVELILCTEEISKDANTALNTYIKSGYKIQVYKEDKKIEIEEKIRNSEIIIDALLGIGSRKEIKEPYHSIINTINSSSAKVISLDIPSGTTADYGEYEISVKAETTLTVQYIKKSAYFYPASENYGNIEIIDAGIILPPNYNSYIQLWTEKDHIKSKQIPEKNIHKGDNGRIAIIGGCKYMVGAPIMTALACARSGAGLISLGIIEDHIPIASQKLLEAMYIKVIEDEGYIVDVEIPRADIITFGMGLGRNIKSENLLKKFLKSNNNIIIDADALYFLKENKELLKNRKGITIVTPHEGEMANICNKQIEHIKNNRFLESKEFAMEYGVYVVLKGANTIVTCPNGKQYVNQSGNPSLAKGGSGDVLAGIISSRVASAVRKEHIKQQINIGESIIDAVYLHGKIADALLKAKENYNNIIPTDIIEAL